MEQQQAKEQARLLAQFKQLRDWQQQQQLRLVQQQQQQLAQLRLEQERVSQLIGRQRVTQWGQGEFYSFCKFIYSYPHSFNVSGNLQTSFYNVLSTKVATFDNFVFLQTKIVTILNMLKIIQELHKHLFFHWDIWIFQRISSVQYDIQWDLFSLSRNAVICSPGTEWRGYLSFRFLYVFEITIRHWKSSLTTNDKWSNTSCHILARDCFTNLYLASSQNMFFFIQNTIPHSVLLFVSEIRWWWNFWHKLYYIKSIA